MSEASLPTRFFRPIEFAGKALGGGQVPAICIPLVARTAVALQTELLAVLALMLGTNAKVYYLTPAYAGWFAAGSAVDRKSTRLNSSHRT